MTTAADRRGAHPRLGHVRPAPTPGRAFGAPLWARLRAPWLDRDLASGIAPWQTPTHSARSLQITSPRARRSLARSLQSLTERADCSARPTSLTAVVPVNRRAILRCGPVIADIVQRLCDRDPINIQGVAALRDVLSDGSGPFYDPLSGDRLTHVLTKIQDSLDVPD